MSDVGQTTADSHTTIVFWLVLPQLWCSFEQPNFKKGVRNLNIKDHFCCKIVFDKLKKGTKFHSLWHTRQNNQLHFFDQHQWQLWNVWDDAPILKCILPCVWRAKMVLGTSSLWVKEGSMHMLVLACLKKDSFCMMLLAWERIDKKTSSCIFCNGKTWDCVKMEPRC